MKFPKDAYTVSKILLVVDFVLMFLYLPLGLIIYSDTMREYAFSRRPGEGSSLVLIFFMIFVGLIPPILPFASLAGCGIAIAQAVDQKNRWAWGTAIMHLLILIAWYFIHSLDLF